MANTSSGGGGPVSSNSGKGAARRRAAIGDGTPAFSIDMSRAAPVNSPMMAYRNPGNADDGSALAGMVNGSGSLNNRAALAALVKHNNTGPKQDIFGGLADFFNTMGARGGASTPHQGGTGGNDSASLYASRGVHPDTSRPSQQQVAAGKFGGTASGLGGGGGSMLDAFRQPEPTQQHITLASDTAPQADLPQWSMPAMPTLNLPSGDYNSYLQQAQKALDFAAIARPYDQAINQIGTDTGIAVGNIGAAAKGAHENIAGGTALIQDGAKQAVGQEAALESALSSQAQGAAGNTAAGAASLAATLGMNGAQGQANPQAASQAQAAQAALAAAAQDNSSTLQANAATQVADNQGYGRVVDAKATADQQNAELAAQDAKAGIGLSKGQSLLGAREQAATNAMGMQQNAISNALGEYNARVQAALGQGGLLQGEQKLGLDKYTAENQVAYQNNTLAAQVAGAKSANLDAAYAPLFAAYQNGLKYNQINPALMGQYTGSAEQLAAAKLAAFGQQADTPTIASGLLDGSFNSGIAPTLSDVLTKNKKKR